MKCYNYILEITCNFILFYQKKYDHAYESMQHAFLKNIFVKNNYHMH